MTSFTRRGKEGTFFILILGFDKWITKMLLLYTVNYAALGHFFDVLGHLFCSIIDLTVYNHGL